VSLAACTLRYRTFAAFTVAAHRLRYSDRRMACPGQVREGNKGASGSNGTTRWSWVRTDTLASVAPGTYESVASPIGRISEAVRTDARVFVGSRVLPVRERECFTVTVPMRQFMDPYANALSSITFTTLSNTVLPGDPADMPDEYISGRTSGTSHVPDVEPASRREADWFESALSLLPMRWREEGLGDLLEERATWQARGRSHLSIEVRTASQLLLSVLALVWSVGKDLLVDLIRKWLGF
jgi:hypothetical protein